MYFRDVCTSHGCDVVGVEHLAGPARETIFAQQPDYVLMDVRLGGKRDGVDIAMEVHDRCPDTKVVFITGSNEPPSLARIHSDHPYRILIKPVSPADIVQALD
jgi:DNA-binding NarL/FixJ family response regulator